MRPQGQPQQGKTRNDQYLNVSDAPAGLRFLLLCSQSPHLSYYSPNLAGVKQCRSPPGVYEIY
jgi:hypothetical protein